MFRVVVQDSRQTPTSGKVVASLGSYDPHTKSAVLDKDKAAKFLENGAQPSERVVLLLQKEGVAIPSWVSVNNAKAGALRNPEKLRRNQPKEEAPAVEESAADNAEAAEAEAPAAETEKTEKEA